MNKKVLLYILIFMNLVALIIDPVLGGIFMLMWPAWFMLNKDRIDE